jgi:two-component system response regulator NreC
VKKIRLLIADDHALIRSGIARLLQSYTDLVVVGEAEDGLEAVDLVKKHQPDVVIIDLSMPRMNGIEATKVIRARFPETKVLVLTMHEGDEYIFQILKSGAGGYILKNSGKEELAAAIRAVARGEKFFSPRVSEIMVESYLKKEPGRHRQPGSDDLPLTKREKEILTLVAQGFTNQEIADRLFISPRTVDTHRTNMMQKLDIHDVVTLVRFAIEHGFVSPKR